MAGGLDVVVEFLADTSQLRKETAKVTGTGTKLKSWAKGVGAAIGAAFAVDQIKEWVGAAAGLQDAMSATQQIFGGAAGDVAKFAKGADKGLGISQKSALDAADTFATFGKSAGLTGAPLAKFATKLTGLAGDLASFRGTSPEQAIEAIGAALRGETEPIRAYGVLLDDATLRQQALHMGLIKTTKQALTPQQKVLAAQAQLFKQTGDAQGDFRRTGDSAANQQKILAAQLENTKAALGTTLLPVLQIVAPILQAIAGFIKENAGWLVPLAAGVLAVAAAVWIWNAAMAANPIMLIVIGVALLVAGIILLVKNWDTVWHFVLGLIQTVWNWIKKNWPLLAAILTGPIGVAVLIITKNWDKIRAAFQAAVDAVVRAWGAFWGWIVAAWAKIAGAAAGMWDAVSDAFRSAAGFVKGVWDGIWSWFTGLPGKIANIAKGMWDGIANAFAAAVNFMIRGWNALQFKIPGFKVGPVHFGGFTLGVPDIPQIPTLARGGLVTSTGLIYAHAGEAITPAPAAARAGPAVVIENAHFSNGVDVETFMRKAAWIAKANRV